MGELRMRLLCGGWQGGPTVRAILETNEARTELIAR